MGGEYNYLTFVSWSQSFPPASREALMGMVYPMMTDTQRKTTAYFVVDLTMLEAGPVVIRRDIPLEWLKKRLIYYEFEAEPRVAEVDVRVERTGNGILVRGEVRADISTFCGTCLKDIVIDVRSNVSTFLVPRTAFDKTREDMELTPEDLDREYYEGDTLTLDDLLGDALMLELPMNPRCRDNCPGLPMMNVETHGTTVDPRLAPLANIRLNKEN